MWRYTSGETPASVSRETVSPRASRPSTSSPMWTVFQASAAFDSKLSALTLFMVSAWPPFRNAPWFAKERRRASWYLDSPRLSWRCTRSRSVSLWKYWEVLEDIGGLQQLAERGDRLRQAVRRARGEPPEHHMRRIRPIAKGHRDTSHRIPLLMDQVHVDRATAQDRVKGTEARAVLEAVEQLLVLQILQARRERVAEKEADREKLFGEAGSVREMLAKPEDRVVGQ